ncbi:polysaccharide biosynthesis protein [Lactobacillus sp. DCY120]|uniref:Polysaccharide biosynthesis protein n=1 Tax=Bombilactobacillus apium TaxID=2675299 RepID=A0A850R4F8_9LACO|nr:polysaccharide biosynthesis protein [Bombilactobacillus apium]NVY96861.1 polysaccharide biosynthesis protein [Bombilactobacillus apium]
MQGNEDGTSDLKRPTSKTSLIKGSVWMTAGSIFSRILGAIYIIPWNMWLGTIVTASLANSLYMKGYNLYSWFLVVSTAGIPGAISKQIAHYNSLNEYSTGNRLFRQGLKIMFWTGLGSAAIMYFGAPIIANIFVGGDQQVVPVLKALAWALLVIPLISIIRGYFQGYSQMAPSAISQFVEQVARVVYMLGATYLIMQVQHGSYVSAVVQSTFAAFIGALFSLGVLMWYFLRQLPRLRKLSRQSKVVENREEQNFLKEIWAQALPFIILDSGIVTFQIFDQATFNGMMHTFWPLSKNVLDSLYALFAFNANKLIMITISLAAAMAVTAVPLLSAAFSQNDRDEIRSQIANTIQLFLLVMIPASLGMYAVAKPLYILFYRYDKLGIYILQFSSIVAILLGLFTVLAAVLQGLYENKAAIKYFFIGLIVKMILQYPLVGLLNVYGPLMATAIGMGVACWLMIRLLCHNFGFQADSTINRSCGIFCLSLVMLIGISLVNWLGYLWINPENRYLSVLWLIIEVVLGIMIYGYLILKTRLAEKIIGGRMAGLRQKLKIK